MSRFCQILQWHCQGQGMWCCVSHRSYSACVPPRGSCCCDCSTKIVHHRYRRGLKLTRVLFSSSALYLDSLCCILQLRSAAHSLFVSVRPQQLLLLISSCYSFFSSVALVPWLHSFVFVCRFFYHEFLSLSLFFVIYLHNKKLRTKKFFMINRHNTFIPFVD